MKLDPTDARKRLKIFDEVVKEIPKVKDNGKIYC